MKNSNILTKKDVLHEKKNHHENVFKTYPEVDGIPIKFFSSFEKKNNWKGIIVQQWIGEIQACITSSDKFNWLFLKVYQNKQVLYNYVTFVKGMFQW